jgi:hypothetical protein
VVLTFCAGVQGPGALGPGGAGTSGGSGGGSGPLQTVAEAEVLGIPLRACGAPLPPPDLEERIRPKLYMVHRLHHLSGFGRGPGLDVNNRGWIDKKPIRPARVRHDLRRGQGLLPRRVPAASCERPAATGAGGLHL